MGTTKKRARKSARKARSRRPKAGAPNKSDFIRSLPAGTSANDAVAKGAAKGLKFTTNLVYAVRGKKKGKPAKAGRRRAAAKPVAAGAHPSATTFRKLVLELGLGTARAMLEDVEARLEALVAGR